MEISIVDLRQDPYLEIFTCNIDQGISIIQKKANSNVLKINKKISSLKFEDFYYNYNEFMRVITYEEFKKKY